MIDHMKRNLMKVMTLGVVAECASAKSTGRSVTIMTYNYTDRYIGDLVVDGAWTGGTDAYGVGGGAQGLLAPADPSRTAVLQIKWITADVYDVATNKYSRMPDQSHQASVEVAKPYPSNPTYLVLHFYSDGHVEAELEAGRIKRRIPPPAGYRR